MGMFDEIKCEYPLPNRPDWATTFQTKDLDCAMDWYTITAQGRLIHHSREWEPTPEELMPQKTGTIRDLIGCIRVVPGSERDIDTNHHGYLNFYTGDSERWIDYTAKFTDGQLVSVEETP